MSYIYGMMAHKKIYIGKRKPIIKTSDLPALNIRKMFTIAKRQSILNKDSFSELAKKLRGVWDGMADTKDYSDQSTLSTPIIPKDALIEYVSWDATKDLLRICKERNELELLYDMCLSANVHCSEYTRDRFNYEVDNPELCRVMAAGLRIYELYLNKRPTNQPTFTLSTNYTVAQAIANCSGLKGSDQ